MCWNSGVRKRLKLCSMMKMRKKSGLRRAQRMYQGRAVKQKDARAAGCGRGDAAGPRFRESAPKKKGAPERDEGPGPFAGAERAGGKNTKQKATPRRREKN